MKSLNEARKRYDVYRIRDLGPRKDIPFLNRFERRKIGVIEASMLDREEILAPFRRKYQRGKWGIEIQER